MDHDKHYSITEPILLNFLKTKHPNQVEVGYVENLLRTRNFEWGTSWQLIMLLYEAFDNMPTEVTYHIQSGCVMVRYRDEEADPRYPNKNIIYDWPGAQRRSMMSCLYLAALDYILWHNQQEKNRQSKKSEPGLKQPSPRT